MPTVEDRYHVDVRLLVPGARVHAINLESGSCVLLAVGRRRVRPGAADALTHRGLPVLVEPALGRATPAIVESPGVLRTARQRRRPRASGIAAASAIAGFAVLAGLLALGPADHDAQAHAPIAPVTLVDAPSATPTPAPPQRVTLPPVPRVVHARRHAKHGHQRRHRLDPAPVPRRDPSEPVPAL